MGIKTLYILVVFSTNYITCLNQRNYNKCFNETFLLLSI